VTYSPTPGYVGGDSFTYTIRDDDNAESNVADVIITILSGEELDQEQTQSGYDFKAYGSRWSGQSFVPTLETLTRLELYVKKVGSPTGDLTASIRSSLTGGDLTTVSIPSGNIGTSYGWIEFDIPDLGITPDDTYHIVLRTTGGDSTNCYAWGFGYYTPYTDGVFWFSSSSGSSWIQYPQYDYCFKVYGRSTPPNIAPVAVADSYTATEDTQLIVATPGVLGNDYDPDTGPGALSTTLVGDVTHGTLNLASNGGFTYDPDSDYYGLDSFTYKIFDGLDYSGTVSVTITVNNVNDAPIGVDDSYNAQENTLLSVNAPGVLGNDIDDDGPSALTAHLISDASHGSLSLAGDGGFTYNPDLDYIGPDSFTYEAYDGQYYSGTVTVSISVMGVNDPPVAVADSYSTNEDTTLNVAAPGVLANDYDPDSSPSSLTAHLIGDVSHGSLNLFSNGGFSYDPETNYHGSDSFTYQAYDGQDYSNTVTVSLSITSMNDAPIAVDDSDATTSGSFVDIDVLVNDYDIDGTINPTTVLIQTDVSHGTTSVNPSTGVVTYTPDPGYTGADSFTYTVRDNDNAESNIANVDVTIIASEQLDQEQTQSGYDFKAYGTRWAGQSFVTGMSSLSKLELYIKKIGSPTDDLTVAIRSSLTGADLTSISVPASSIGTGYSWVEFDIPDVSMTPGNTYYIVLRTNGGSSSNSYSWGFGYYTPYTNGVFWFSSNSGGTWSQYPQYDFCFRTFGAP
jgi:VCBS repeat-containing protein